MHRTHRRKRSRSNSRSNQASMESTQSSDPSSNGDTANEIVTKVEVRFKWIKEDSIKAGRSMELRTDVCSQLEEQKRNRTTKEKHC